MLNRLEALADEEKNKGVDLKRYRETSDKIIKLVGIAVPTVSSVDDAKAAVDNVIKELPNILLVDAEREQRIRLILSMSRLLDKNGFGLKERRNRDGKYGRLLRAVEDYYDHYKGVVDDELRSLIRSHVAFAEASANALLFIRGADAALTLASSEGVPNLLTPVLEADIEGFDDDIQEIARVLRVEIGQYIRKLG